MPNKTIEYLARVRKKTGLSDYKISKKYDINQSNLSKYSSGKSALSETHAWLFADILGINPAEVVAQTKLEHAKLSQNKIKADFWRDRLKSLTGKPDTIRIDIAQINPVVGDIYNNALKIINLSEKATLQGVHLLIFPELALVGYPPEDLLLRTQFIQEIESSIQYILKKVPTSISVLFGAPSANNLKGVLYNSAYLIQQGVIRIYHKQKLPNYGVFDEKRYFKSGEDGFLFECQGRQIGVLICEDAWSKEPARQLANFGAKTIITLNASPFQIGKHQQRIKTIKARALENKVEFI
jgi:NAD+ synthase (glutamine-hydrolysing)